MTTPRQARTLIAIWTVTALTIAAVIALGTRADAHPAPAPGTGGWIHTALRPDGLPITHYCGTIRFSINDGGNTGVAVAIRSAVYETYLITGQDFLEVPPGTVVNGITLQWDWPDTAPGNQAGWTKTRNDGWNWTRNDVWINPARFQGPDLQYLPYVIRHELGHAYGMAHTTANPTVMGQIWPTYKLVDGAALLYLLGHPPALAEPCFRTG